MKLFNINENKYFHMIPLWKSPIKLLVELPVEQPPATTRLVGPPTWAGSDPQKYAKPF